MSRLLKIIGLFCKKKSCKRDDILQKRPVILESLLIVAISKCLFESKDELSMNCVLIKITIKLTLEKFWQIPQRVHAREHLLNKD